MANVAMLMVIFANGYLSINGVSELALE